MWESLRSECLSFTSRQSKKKKIGVIESFLVSEKQKDASSNNFTTQMY